MAIPFTKMQGIGNDYVYIDASVQSYSGLPELARRVSDRHFGIGSDGLIMILRSELDDVDYRMQMFNADGSESEMCGNGLRCVAKYIYDRAMVDHRPERFPIETGAGVLTVDVIPGPDGLADKVRVNMGEPRLKRGEIPMSGPADEQAVNATINAGGRDFSVTCVSMGNPHCVIYCDERPTDDLVHGFGSRLENHEVFPRRSNIEFVQVVSPTRLIQRTWERGAGETLACGTGASAVCVAGVLTGRSHRKVTIELLGGELELEWNEADNCVYKTGPAVEVFSGEWPA